MKHESEQKNKLACTLVQSNVLAWKNIKGKDSVTKTTICNTDEEG